MIASSKTKCLTCEREAKVRGLCKRCHVAALRAIKSGEATEKSLVKQGLILESKRGATVKSPWTKKFIAGGKGHRKAIV